MRLATGTAPSSGARSTAGGSWLRAVQVFGVSLILVGVIVIANPAQAQEHFPLDKYPGLGRSPDAAQRDDTIAAWEAFRREQVIASCTARSGFKHVPAVPFPEDPLAAVARSLGVVPAAAGGPSPWEQNKAYEATLSGQALDRYARTLYGESAADMAETWRTGGVPTGRGADFAMGGCLGESTAAVPSVWALKRELAAELELMRQDIANSSEMASTGDAYAGCAKRVGAIDARGPGDVERLSARDESPSTARTSVIKQCGDIWAVGYRNAEFAAVRRFEQRNRTVLRAAEERYRRVPDAITADLAFRAYLAQYARSGR